MSGLTSIFKKPIVVIILGLLLTVAIASTTGYFFVLPQYNSLADNQKQAEGSASKLAILTKNIANIKNLNQEQISGYISTINSFFPEQNDYLHFADLNDQLARDIGLNIGSFTVSVAKTTAPSPASTASGSIGGSVGGTSAPAAPATSSPPTAGPIMPGYNVVVTYTGSYDKVTSLLTKLRSLDRAVGVGRVSISGGTNFSTSITYFLPLSTPGQTSIGSDSNVILSASDKDFLNKLGSSIQFVASPADIPLGKTNPFN